MVDPQESAPEDTAEPPRPSRLRRWSRRVVRGLVLLGLLLGALYLTRGGTLHPLLCRVATWAGERAGMQVRLGELRGDWWRDLELIDLEVRSSRGGPGLRSLKLDRAALAFHLPELLRRGLDGLDEIRLGSVRAELDLRAGSSSSSPGSGSVELPSSLPLIEVGELDLVASTDSGDLELVDLQTTGAGSGIDMRADRITFDGEVRTSGPVSCRLDWKGGRTASLSSLSVGSLLTDGVVHVDLTGIASGSITSELELELVSGGTLVGTARSNGGRLEVDISRGQLELAPTLQSLSDLGIEVPSLASLGGTATLTGGLTTGEDGLEARVEISGLGVEYHDRRVEHLEAQVRLGPGGAWIDRLAAGANGQRLLVTEAYLPFENILEDLSATVDVDLVDLGGWIRGTPDQDSLPLHRLVVKGSILEGRTELEEGRLEVADGQVLIRGGRLDLSAPPTGPRTIQLDASLDLPDLSALGTILGLDAWSGELGGDVRITGPLSGPVGAGQLLGKDVVLSGFPLGEVDVEVEADGREVRVSRLSARSDSLEIEASGGWDIPTASLDVLELEAQVGGLHRFGFEPGGALSARASLDGSPLEPTGQLSIHGNGLIIGGVSLADAVLEAKAETGNILIDSLSLTTVHGRVALAARGLVDRDGTFDFEISGLALESGQARLATNSPARLRGGAGGLALEGLELSGTAGSIDFTGSRIDEVLTSNVSVSALQLDNFLGHLLPDGTSTGEVSGSATMGPDGKLAYDLQVNGARLDPQSPLADVRSNGSLFGNWLDLGQLEVSVGGIPTLTAEGRVPLPHKVPDGILDLQVHTTLSPDLPVGFVVGDRTGRIIADASLQAELAGSWSEPSGQILLRAGSVRVEPEELAQPFLEAPASVELEVDLDGGVRIPRLEISLPGRLEASGKGQLEDTVDLANLLAGQLDELMANEVSLQATASVPDTSWVTPLLGARRSGGKASAELSLQGPLRDPSWSGRVTVEEGSLKYSGVPEVEHVALDVDLSSEGVQIREAHAELGASRVSLEGGVTTGEGEPRLDLALSGSNVLLQRSSSLRLRGNLDLALTGSPESPELSGEVHLVNSKLLQQVDLFSLLDVRNMRRPSSAQRGITLPSFRTGPLAAMKLDVDIDTGEPVVLAGNVTRGEVGLDLHVGGTGEVIVPTGVIFLDKGKIALPGGTMRFDRGLVTFTEENPYMPHLDLNGEARLAGFDVEMRVEGSLEEVQIDPTTYPPLDRRDALMLMLTGQVPASGQAAATAAQSLGLYLARDLARRWAGGTNLSDDDDEGLLDRLVIVSGQEVSSTGLMTVEVSYRAFDDLLTNSDSVFVVGERDVYEDYNIGLRVMLRDE